MIPIRKSAAAATFAVALLSLPGCQFWGGQPPASDPDLVPDAKHSGAASCSQDGLDGLAATEWVLEDLAGDGIIDRSRVTVTFLVAEGRVTGRASCNRYQADFTLCNKQLAFTQLGQTLMVCPPALMNQEERFFRIFQGVDQWTLEPTGALLLAGPQGWMRGFAAEPNPEHLPIAENEPTVPDPGER